MADRPELGPRKSAVLRAVVEEYEKKETDPALKRAARAALESL